MTFKDEDGGLLVVKMKEDGKILGSGLLMMRKKEINDCVYDMWENSGANSTSSDGATSRGVSLHHGEAHRWVGG